MTSARRGVAKKQEKIAWIIRRDRLGLLHGIDLSSISATQTAWSMARRGGGANETDTGNLHDVIAGSSLEIATLGFEKLEIEIREIEILGIEMLHRLSVLSRSQWRRGSRDGR